MRAKTYISYARSIAKDHLGKCHIIRDNVGIYLSPSKKSIKKIKSKIKKFVYLTHLICKSDNKYGYLAKLAMELA